MKKRPLLAILALLMLSLVAVGCPRTIVEVEIEPPPPGPYPAPPKEWSRTFGGPNSEWAISVQQTADRGFIVAGSTMSFGAGETDSWLIRTDEEGNKVWSRTFGGPNSEWATSVQQTACGGFIIAGNTSSFGAGQADFWLVKTDPDGNEQWSRTFGGYWWEGASSVQQTACGGFIIAGSTSSFGAGQADFWLVKTDPDGNEQWSRTFGGPYLDRAYSVQQTACGGFIIAGETQSFGAGCQDFWLVKTDEEGNKEWANTLGGALSDFARSVQQTACGGFIIAGDTSSFGALGTNFRLIKLAPER
ncbi:hypothetical protein M1O18_00015 [Dehalococcoidia bacterium]|nr:hypothetical protein [Dehalococcoidia bacterium]